MFSARKPAPGIRRAPNSVFCPEKPGNSSPLNSSSLVTASSPLAFWVQKCAKPGPVPELLLRRVFRGPTARRGPGSESDSPPRWSVSPPSLSPLKSPLHPAPFLVQKSAPFFVSDCKSSNSQVFGGKRAPDDHFAQFSAFGPEKRRIPARRACHRLSPLCHRSLWGRKVRKRLGKTSLQPRNSKGLENLVDPASSHMLVSKPFLKRSRARFLPGPPLIIKSQLHRSRKSDLAPHRSRIGAWCGPGAGLVRAWCGPGAGLVRAWCGPGAGANPGLGAGLPQSILLWAQDCFTQSCRHSRIAPQLWLGAVLARAQPCDGACPAVELPGFRHVVYAQNKGQAACEERVSELRVEGQVMPPPPRAIVVHAATWEDVGRVGIDTMPRRLAGQSA